MNVADALDAEAAELERCAARLRERALQLRERVVPAPNERRFLRARDVAELIGVNARTIRRWRSEGILPPALEIEGIVRWDRRAVDAWLAARSAASNQASQVRCNAG